MTIVEIRPHGCGWRVFESPGVEPVFPEKRQAAVMSRGFSGKTKIESSDFESVDSENGRLAQ